MTTLEIAFACSLSANGRSLFASCDKNFIDYFGVVV